MNAATSGCKGCIFGFPLGTGLHTMETGCAYERVTCTCGARRQKSEPCSACGDAAPRRACSICNRVHESCFGACVYDKKR